MEHAAERPHRHEWKGAELGDGVLEQVAERLAEMEGDRGWRAHSFACSCGAQLVSNDKNSRAIRVDQGVPWCVALGVPNFEYAGPLLWMPESEPPFLHRHSSQEEVAAAFNALLPQGRHRRWQPGTYQEWEVGPANWEEEDNGRDVLTASLYPVNFDPSKEPLRTPPPFGSTLIPKDGQIVLLESDADHPGLSVGVSIEELAKVLAAMTKTEREGGSGGYHYSKHREILEEALRLLLATPKEEIDRLIREHPDQPAVSEAEVGALMQGDPGGDPDDAPHWVLDIWKRLRKTQASLTLYEVARAVAEGGAAPRRQAELESELDEARARRAKDAEEVRDATKRADALLEASRQNAVIANSLLKVVPGLAKQVRNDIAADRPVSYEARTALDNWDSLTADTPTKDVPSDEAPEPR